MIRDAKETDFDAILDMCEQFWGHTSYSEPFERDHVLKMVEIAFEQGLLIVLDAEGVQGFIAGVYSPLLGSSQAMAGTELAWWVNPVLRGSGVGFRLLRAMEYKARRNGIKYWNMASMKSSDDSHANSIYERAGYKLNETLYQKVL